MNVHQDNFWAFLGVVIEMSEEEMQELRTELFDAKEEYMELGPTCRQLLQKLMEVE